MMGWERQRRSNQGCNAGCLPIPVLKLSITSAQGHAEADTLGLRSQGNSVFTRLPNMAEKGKLWFARGVNRNLQSHWAMELGHPYALSVNGG